MKCDYCEKALCAIGDKRKNGKSHADWKTRNLHKKCFIYLRENQMYKCYGCNEYVNKYFDKCINRV